MLQTAHKTIAFAKRAEELLKLIRQAKAEQRPEIQKLWCALLHSAYNERVWRKYAGEIEARIIGAAAANEIYARYYVPPADDIPEERRILAGHQTDLGLEVFLDRELLSSHLCVTGATGSGKTNFELHVLDQNREKLEWARFWDIKGEGRRFPDFWPGESIIFTPQDMPEQWLEPPLGADPLIYGIGVVSEIRSELVEMHSATFSLVWQAWERVTRGLQPGDPFPSISDFRRILEHEAKVQNRENLLTAARIFLSLETILGRNACVRKAADISGRYKIIVFEFIGQDPKIFRLFLGLHFHKLLMKAQQEEHTASLRALEVIDEAAPICSIELTARGVENLSSLKRFITQARFMGIGLVIGCQNISQIDPFVKNCGTVIAFRTPSVADAIDAAKMLGLPLDATEELMRLKPGEAFVRSAGWEQAVRIQTPLFTP